MKIMIIGNMGFKSIAKHYANFWEKEGYEIIRISTDVCRFEDSGKFDYHIMKEISKHNVNEAVNLQMSLSRFPIAVLTDMYEPDIIFEVQHKITLDYRNMNIPVYYQITEPTDPVIPTGANLKGIFYSWMGAEDELRHIYPYEMNYLDFCKFILIGYDHEVFKISLKDLELDKNPISNNSPLFSHIKLGFMGALTNYGGKDSGFWKIKHIYDNRRRIVKYAIDELKLEWNQYGNLNDYIKFMQRVSIALNISGNFGCINDRTFHAQALGCVLLQFEDPEYPSLTQFGYIDKINCLLFSSLLDLREKINWIEENPLEVEYIRKKGIQFTQKNTYQIRAKEILNYLKENGVLK